MFDIPEQAIIIARDHIRNDEDDERDAYELAEVVLNDVGPMIVAAYLRRLAEQAEDPRELGRLILHARELEQS